MTFHVGQKVICIRGPRRPLSCIVPIEIGKIYTIRLTEQDSQGEYGCLLEEVVNPLNVYGLEYGYYADRFRPVVERETDISVFTEILRKVTRKDRVRA